MSSDRVDEIRVKVMVVDDQPPFRAAARAVVGRIAEFELVSDAASGEEAVALGQPAGLAGGLAGAPAGSCAAVPLALTAAMVGDEKLPARHALALSRLGHRRSPTNPTNPSSATTTPTEHSSARSLKKTAKRC